MRHDHHFHDDQVTAGRLDRIDELLGIILDNQETIMSSLEEIQAQQADTDVKIAAVAVDVAALQEKITNFPKPGLTPEQQAAIDDIAAHGAKINDGLSAIDSSVNPPSA